MSDNNNKKHRSFGPTTLSVNNGISIFLVTLMILVAGVQSYLTMPKEQFPDIVIPTIYIGTAYSGNSAEDMENLVTKYIEKEIATISGVDKLTSTSIQDYSTIVVEFSTDIEVEQALREVKDAVDKAESDLPNDLTDGPNVFEINFSEVPIMSVNISGEFSPEELRGYAEYLQDEFEKLTEISEVELKGVPEREIRVDMDLPKMQSLRVSFNDVENAIKMENITVSAGEFLVNDFRRSIRVVGEFKTIEELENIIIKSERQRPIFLKEIAQVSQTYEDATSIARSDKLPVVSLDVIKRSGENLLDAADKIKEIIKEASRERFPESLSVTVFNDQSVNTRNQVANLQNSIISGVLLVVLVLLFFLGLRNASFVGLAIPLSMFLGILILNLMGVTLNIVVLFSLILALGLLVDNAIVVVENIYRYRQEGYSSADAAKFGAGEVAMPIIASTATTLAAFVPLMFWPGIFGEFMQYLPLTLIIVLISSLVVALMINPVFADSFMKVEEQNPSPEQKRRSTRNALMLGGGVLALSILAHLAEVSVLGNLALLSGVFILLNYFILRPSADFFQNRVLVALEDFYDGFIRRVLFKAMPYIVFAGTIVLLIVSLGLFASQTPKVEFFPEGEPTYVNVFVELPVGADIDATNTLMQELEAKVENAVAPYREKGIIEAVLAQVGENTGDPSGPPEQGATPNKGRITVSFIPEEEKRKGISTYEVLEVIRESVQGYAGVEVIVDRNQSGPPTGKPINLEIIGDDKKMEELLAISLDVKKFLDDQNVPGVEELKADVIAGVQEQIIEIDREAARRYGVSTYDIAMSLRTALYGKEVSKFKVGEDEYPIMVRFADEYRYDEQALMNQRVTFRNPSTGQVVQVPISAVAKKRPSTTYNAVKRNDERRVITIYSNVLEGYNANEIVEEFKGYLAAYEFPDGYDYRFTGEQEEQAETMNFLVSAFAIAGFSIFIILVSLFNSMIKPVIVFLTIIFSTIGVFMGYTITGSNLVIVMTGIGIVSLAGIVVNNAIVLIDYIDYLRTQMRKEQGLAAGEELSAEDVKKAIILGGKTRLRPVLLTAITTILGLIPLAIGFNFDFTAFLVSFDTTYYTGGSNAATWGPMAWTVIYGLTFATFLTLIAVPAMYWLAFRLTRVTQRLMGKGQ